MIAAQYTDLIGHEGEARVVYQIEAKPQVCTAVDHKQSYHLTDLYYDPLNSLLSSHLIEFHVYGLSNLMSIGVHLSPGKSLFIQVPGTLLMAYFPYGTYS